MQVMISASSGSTVTEEGRKSFGHKKRKKDPSWRTQVPGAYRGLESFVGCRMFCASLRPFLMPWLKAQLS